jgi:hypothetical protein
VGGVSGTESIELHSSLCVRFDLALMLLIFIIFGRISSDQNASQKNDSLHLVAVVATITSRTFQHVFFNIIISASILNVSEQLRAINSQVQLLNWPARASLKTIKI